MQLITPQPRGIIAPPPGLIKAPSIIRAMPRDIITIRRRGGYFSPLAGNGVFNDPIHFWPMDDANVSGTTISDIGTIGGDTGTANGGVTSAAGPGSHTARAFDGVSGTSIHLASSPFNWNSGSFSWASWVWITNNANLAQDSNQQIYFHDERTNTGDNYFQVYNRSAGPGGLGMDTSRGTSNAASISIPSTTVVNSSTWTHLVYTNTGGGPTGTPLVYVNGVSVAFSAASASNSSFNSIDSNIGSGPSSTFSNLVGRLFGTRIYSRALSATDVSALFAAGV